MIKITRRYRELKAQITFSQYCILELSGESIWKDYLKNLTVSTAKTPVQRKRAQNAVLFA